MNHDPSKTRAADTEGDLFVSERLFAISHDLLCLVDAEGRFQRVNSAFTRSLGWSETELVGRPFLDFVHPDDCALTRSSVEQLLAGVTPETVENRYVCKDGAYRWFSWLATTPDSHGHLYGVGRDITEQRRITDALRANEERFRTLNESSPIGIFESDLEGAIRSANPAMLRLCGFTSEHEALGFGWATSVHPDDRQALIEGWRHALRELREYEHECRVVRPDDSIRNVHGRTAPLRDARGVIVGAVGTLEDVTARRQAERELRRQADSVAESEARHRRLVETLHDGICTVDARGDITYANLPLRRMLGCEAHDLSGKSLFAFMDPDVAFAMRTRFARRQRGISEVEVLCLRRADGGTLWARKSSSSTFDADGTFTGAVFVLSDVTEQHEAQHRLAQSERHFRALTEQSSELISIFAADGTIKYANPAYGRLLGHGPGERIGRSAFEMLHPDDVEMVRAKFAALVRTPGGLDAVEYRARHKDGSYRSLSTVARNLLHDPAVEGIVANSHDVTAHRQAESELRRQNEMLQVIFDHIPVMVLFMGPDGDPQFVNREWERVLGYSVEDARTMDVVAEMYPNPRDREYVAEFMRAASRRWGTFRTRVKDGRVLDTMWANVKLSDGSVIGIGQDVTDRRQLEEQFRQSQKMEAIGLLAGGVAHDFNNLLTVITSYAMMVLSEMQAEDPLRGDLREIQLAAERAAALTRQLLAFSRQQVLNPRVVALTEIISGMERMLQRLIGEDIALTIRCGDDPGFVRADAGQLEQVVMNLVVNARDAMPAGGQLEIRVDTTVLTAEDAARFSFIDPGEFARISVRDTGSGMDEFTRSRIFEPFFTTKEVGKGTGLGLATVYGIVKQSGGYIWVDSAPGEGTTFWIHLPRVSEPASPALGDQTVAADQAGRRHATILLVEDEDSLRTIMERVLRKRGYAVLSASNGIEALSVATKHIGTIDLLVTDVVMPQGSGQQLAHSLAMARGERPVLFVSGYSMEAVTNYGMLRAGSRLLKKPFTPHDLVLAVSELLHRTAPATTT